MSLPGTAGFWVISREMEPSGVRVASRAPRSPARMSSFSPSMPYAPTRSPAMKPRGGRPVGQRLHRDEVVGGKGGLNGSPDISLRHPRGSGEATDHRLLVADEVRYHAHNRDCGVEGHWAGGAGVDRAAA